MLYVLLGKIEQAILFKNTYYIFVRKTLTCQTTILKIFPNVLYERG